MPAEETSYSRGLSCGSALLITRLVSRGLVLGVQGCVAHFVLGLFKTSLVDTETVLVSAHSFSEPLEWKHLGCGEVGRNEVSLFARARAWHRYDIFGDVEGAAIGSNVRFSLSSRHGASC